MPRQLSQDCQRGRHTTATNDLSVECRRGITGANPLAPRQMTRLAPSGAVTTPVMAGEQAEVSPWLQRAVLAAPKDAGTLCGLTFAAKGCIDVAGLAPCLGNPTWDDEQVAATANAPVVEALLAAGASLHGTTGMDELLLGVTGGNPHHGMPINPAAPDRVPGGSSSGSAAVVARGDVDFALGTDTGGSVRVPASFCGTWGLRPSVGVVPIAGIQPNAETLDTVGVFARDGAALAAVAAVLCAGCGPVSRPSAGHEQQLTTLLLPEELWALADKTAAEQLRHELLARASTGSMQACRVEEVSLSSLLGPLEEGGKDVMAEQVTGAFLAIGAAEVWANRKEWMERQPPEALSPGLRETLLMFGSSSSGTSEMQDALRLRHAVRKHLGQRLSSSSVLLAFPTTPSAAPPREASCGQKAGAATGPLSDANAAIQGLCALSTLSGFPQVTAPLGALDGAPLGLSLLGGPGSDVQLVESALALLC